MSSPTNVVPLRFADAVAAITISTSASLWTWMTSHPLSFSLPLMRLIICCLLEPSIKDNEHQRRQCKAHPVVLFDSNTVFSSGEMEDFLSKDSNKQQMINLNVIFQIHCNRYWMVTDQYLFVGFVGHLWRHIELFGYVIVQCHSK